MASTTVYAASSGSYSDYSVALLFTTKELAEAFTERQNNASHSADYSVEQFELWDELPGEPVTIWIAEVEMTDKQVKVRHPTRPHETEPWGNRLGLEVTPFGARAVAPSQEEADRLLGEWVEEQMRTVPKLPTIAAVVEYLERGGQP